jgi:hypothetical protein
LKKCPPALSATLATTISTNRSVPRTVRDEVMPAYPLPAFEALCDLFLCRKDAPTVVPRADTQFIALDVAGGAPVPCSSTIGQLPLYDLCVLVAQMCPSHWGWHDHGYLLAVLRVRFAVQLKQISLLKHNPHKDVTGRSN